MLISHLLLKNYGKFENFSCDFSPGLNLIKGPNEAGKSTLAEAITAALFLNPSEKQNGLEKKVHWGSHGAPIFEAIIRTDGKSYHLTKDFTRGQAILEDNSNGTKESQAQSVNDWISRQLGMQSEEIFKATACINQGEITHIENSIDAIKDKLESMVTGGKEERTASIAISKLRKRIAQIGGDDGSGGELGELEKASREIEYNIEKLTREIAALKAKRADLIQVEMAYRNGCEDLISRKEKFESSRKAVKLEDEFLKLSAESKELQGKLEEAQEALKKIKKLRDRQAELKNIDQKDITEIESLETNLKYLHPKKRELEEDAIDAKRDFNLYRIGMGSSISIGIGALGMALFISSIFWDAVVFLYPALWYGLGGSGIVLALGITVMATRRQHRNYLKTRMEKTQAKLAEVTEQVERQAPSLKQLLTRYKANSAEELKKHFWQFDDIEQQVQREKAAYESILSGQPLQELENLCQAVEDSIALNKKQKKDLTGEVVDGQELGRQKLVLSQFQDRLKDLEQERQVLRHQMETAEGGAELLASYLERRDALNTQKNALKEEIKRHQFTIECINEARQNVLVSTLEVLNARTSEILNQFTSGRYSRVRFDKASFKFEVFSEEKEGWIDPEATLSSSTVEQIYLSARLALADLIADDKNSVLILDDPFANYDEKRLESAMRVLKQLSEDHQILLLTSQSHYDKWADSTISL